MRITVGDPDAMRAKVFFNGAQVSTCVMADEERGEVIVYATDRTGHILVSHTTGNALAETAHGSVSVFIAQCHAGDGFDAWMRERTDAAHQAMMKHARRGGQRYGLPSTPTQSRQRSGQVVLASIQL